MEWQKCSGGSYPQNAFIAGARDGNNPLLVSRALQNGSLIPGKLMKGLRHSHVSFGGKEYEKQEYEVLLHQQGLVWLPASAGHLPLGSLPLGHEDGVSLYSIKGKVNNTEVLGKYHSKYKTGYLQYGGKEHERVDGF